MRPYDKSKPLYFCHIPRTAGVVTWSWFRELLGEGRIRGSRTDTPGPGQVGRGHWDFTIGQSLVDLHPEAEQFVTVMRDPFDRLVSWYFYLKNHWHGSVGWGAKALEGTISLRDYGGTLREFLRRYPADVSRFLPVGSRHVRPLPEMLDDFVLVGADVALREFSVCLAGLFGKPAPRFWRGNRCGVRDEPVTDAMRAEFREGHQADYELYNYAVETWRPVWGRACTR